jgi:hypothetical protein
MGQGMGMRLGARTGRSGTRDWAKARRASGTELSAATRVHGDAYACGRGSCSARAACARASGSRIRRVSLFRVGPPGVAVRMPPVVG